MKPVVLDTVGLIAAWDQDDQWHEPAALAFQSLKSSRAPLLTTTFILAECANAARGLRSDSTSMFSAGRWKWRAD